MPILYLGSCTVAGTVCVPSFSRYWRPGSSASSPIQTIAASNWSAICGGVRRQSMSPREQSTSFGKSERDRLAGRRLVELAVHGDDPRHLGRAFPPARSAIRSPGLTAPARDRAGVEPLRRRGSPSAPACGRGGTDGVPAPPPRARRARSGLRTRPSAPSAAVTLSPSSAQTGIAVTASIPAAVGEALHNRRESPRTAPGRSRPGPSCSPPARTAGCRAGGRSCCAAGSGSARPCVASTSTMARSALDAPVAMLRVYCSWPGVSARMKRRLSRPEIEIGDVDGDALLALGLEPVGEQGEIGEAVQPVPRAPRRNRAAGGRSGSTCRRRPSRR